MNREGRASRDGMPREVFLDRQQPEWPGRGIRGPRNLARVAQVLWGPGRKYKARSQYLLFLRRWFRWQWDGRDESFFLVLGSFACLRLY